ncbi:hypothetical protein ES703_110241 [subsurface metagenome]
MKDIILDQIRVVDSRFPHKLRSSIESSIWQEIGTDNSVVLQYKLDFLEALSLLIKREIEEEASNLPSFHHYKSEIQQLNTRNLDDNKIVRIIFENTIIGALIEAFLMETTSILDITAGISGKFLNTSFNTFSKKGQRVLNHLRQNCKKLKHQKELIRLIQHHKKVWIDDVFKLRDDVSHYKNLPNLFSFHIDINNKWDGKSFDNKSLRNPTIGNLDLGEFIEFVNRNLLSFVTEYLRLSINNRGDGVTK